MPRAPRAHFATPAVVTSMQTCRFPHRVVTLNGTADSSWTSKQRRQCRQEGARGAAVALVGAAQFVAVVRLGCCDCCSAVRLWCRPRGLLRCGEECVVFVAQPLPCGLRVCAPEQRRCCRAWLGRRQTDLLPTVRTQCTRPNGGASTHAQDRLTQLPTRNTKDNPPDKKNHCTKQRTLRI